MKLHSYLAKGISFEQYQQDIEKEINTPSMHTNFTQHTILNQKRMQRLGKTFVLNAEQKQELAGIQKEFDLLIITEAWCGDASQILPIVKIMLQEMPKISAKIVYRDQHVELMDEFHTNQSHSIPILVLVDKATGEAKFRYGPRPSFGMKLLAKHKSNPEEYPKAKFYPDLQKAYNQDKGQTIYQDLVQLFKQM